MLSPDELITLFPLGPRDISRVAAHRIAICRILSGEDPRGLIILGPCSLHDPKAALEYGIRLASLSNRVKGKLFLVMRAYVEKSRTSLGWRGLAEEPLIDGHREPEVGVKMARKLLVSLSELGLPLGMEIVSPFLWRYWSDCVSWAAVGARGVEAQFLRETAAALPFPCGFKNGLAGSPDSALAAALVASTPCDFLGIDMDGKAALVRASGNPLPHLVLRGGKSGRGLFAGGPRPNIFVAKRALASMRDLGLMPALLIDAAHDNRRPFGQAFAARAALRLAKRGRSDPALAGIRGLMLESNLEAGSQAPGPPETRRYGVSITDSCLGWAETEALILDLADRMG